MSGSKFLRGVTKVDCGAHNHDNGHFNKDRNLEDHVSSIDNVQLRSCSHQVITDLVHVLVVHPRNSDVANLH